MAQIRMISKEEAIVMLNRELKQSKVVVSADPGSTTVEHRWWHAIPLSTSYRPAMQAMCNWMEWMGTAIDRTLNIGSHNLIEEGRKFFYEEEEMKYYANQSTPELQARRADYIRDQLKQREDAK